MEKIKVLANDRFPCADGSVLTAMLFEMTPEMRAKEEALKAKGVSKLEILKELGIIPK